MRLDKFLKVSRIIKRRTVANEACSGGRVSLNGKVAKPGAEVKENDVLEIRFGSRVGRYRIVSIKEVVRKEGAADMYEVLEEDACLSIKDLAIDGWDLQQAGFLPGPNIGKCLSWLLGQVQDEVLPNEKTVLLSTVKQLLEEKE